MSARMHLAAALAHISPPGTAQLGASRQDDKVSPGARAGAQARMHLAAWQKTLVTVTEVAKKARRAARKGLVPPPTGAPGAAAASASAAEAPLPAGGGAAGAGVRAAVPEAAGAGASGGMTGIPGSASKGPGVAEGQGGAAGGGAGGVGPELQAELDEAMERVQKWQEDVVRLRKCVRCAALPAGRKFY